MDKSIEEIIVWWRKALASGYHSSCLNASETGRLISEIERLRNMVDKEKGISSDEFVKVMKKDKEIERLRKAFKTYGIHNEGCSIYVNCHNKCTCGFEKTLKEDE